MKHINRLVCVALFGITYQSSSHAVDSSQWADTVLGFSTEYSSSGWSASKALGAPDVLTYGDNSNAWAPSTSNGTLEYIELGYPQAVYAYGASIRETYGNGYVYRVDIRDTGGVWHKVWEGTDPSKPGQPVNFFVSWNTTNYRVDGVKVYTNTDHNLSTWEELDAVQLHGLTTNTVPALSIKAPDNIASESYSSTGVFVITREAFADINNPIVVKYAIQGTAVNGVDYNSAAPLTGTVTIPAGKRTVGLLIKPVSDTTAEGPEKVTLVLKTAANYQVLTKYQTATVTINQ